MSKPGSYVDPDRIRSVEHSRSALRRAGVRDAARRAAGRIRFCCRPATPTRAATSAPDYADALFTLHGSLEDGQRYYADVKGRATSFGRDPDQLKVFPAATFVLGDTDDEAEDKARHIRHQQVSGATAIAMLEQVWGRDLSDYDPDGPLPDIDPIGDTGITQGRVATATRLRWPAVTANAPRPKISRSAS